MQKLFVALGCALSLVACSAEPEPLPAPAPLAIYGNKQTFEIAPVLLAAEHYYPGEASIRMGSIANLVGEPPVPGFGEEGEADLATNAETQALRYSVPQGRRLPMHALAAGKVLLAALNPQDLDRYFSEVVLEPFTSETVTDEARLRDQLAEARHTGFAMTDEEFSRGIVGIARLVTMGGTPVGSLSVAVPKVRFDDDLHARVADLLERTASLLEDS